MHILHVTCFHPVLIAFHVNAEMPAINLIAIPACEQKKLNFNELHSRQYVFFGEIVMRTGNMCVGLAYHLKTFFGFIFIRKTQIRVKFFASTLTRLSAIASTT